MKNIEIKTTQNVVLEYELAPLQDRAIAYFIDLAVLFGGILVLSIGFAVVRYSTTATLLYTIFLSAVFFFYAPVMEFFNNGQSVGKLAMRIQVIKTAGGQAGFSEYAARWAFRIIDIYLSLGGIAALMVASSAKAQRIGDIVGNTAVIKLQSKTELNLQDLLAIHKQDSYQPKYLQVKQLQEEDVLLIKTVLDRHAEFNNTAHDEALRMLADRIRTVLEIDGVEHDLRKFLQTILKDYVVLTR